MEIVSLERTPLKEIMACMSESFDNYFVQFPTQDDYWRNKFDAAQVRYDLSFGAFEGERLIAFLLNALEDCGRPKLAFNAGIGVTQACRGKKVVESLYASALPILKEQGIDTCRLEVIEQNQVAIFNYEKIGFHITRQLLSFQGFPVTAPSNDLFSVQRTDYPTLRPLLIDDGHFYSWNHKDSIIARQQDCLSFFQVYDKGTGHRIGYFILHKDLDEVLRAEWHEDSIEGWQNLYACIATVKPHLKQSNIPSSRINLINALKKMEMDNYINQYEMEKDL